MNGAELIAVERQRQIDAEGFGMAHDDEHTESELAWAAIGYAAPAPIWRDAPGCRGNEKEGTLSEPFPWADSWDKRPSIWDDGECTSADRQRALVKAGALLAAEIDRLQRKAARELAQLYPQPR